MISFDMCDAMCDEGFRGCCNWFVCANWGLFPNHTRRIDAVQTSICKRLQCFAMMLGAKEEMLTLFVTWSKIFVDIENIKNASNTGQLREIIPQTNSNMLWVMTALWTKRMSSSDSATTNTHRKFQNLLWTSFSLWGLLPQSILGVVGRIIARVFMLIGHPWWSIKQTEVSECSDRGNNLEPQCSWCKRLSDRWPSTPLYKSENDAHTHAHTHTELFPTNPVQITNNVKVCSTSNVYGWSTDTQI